MERKSYTVILVPHARAQFRKYQVTNVQVWGLALFLAFGTLLAAALAWLHFSSPVDQEKLAVLQSENRSLREVNQAFETSLRDLQVQLDRYEERTRQLAIVAGLEEIESNESGLGGPVVLDTHDPEAVGFLAAQLDQLTGKLEQVETELDDRYRWIASVPSITPARGLLTSGYGMRRDPITGKRALHNGLDISGPAGQPIIAPADGLVVRTGRMGHLGNAVYVSHGYGLTTRYGHMSRIAVKPGDQVERGDVIGYIGNTGRSTGPHLHYEVLRDGKPVDPLAYLLDRG
jgi:murein DD-endopeptidase MepM/ murein hydrolase activator NlpD